MSIKIALAGNPNCGKTTLFNNLTGSNQYVGNWPGVTVEKKEGKLKGDKDVIIQDLPGIYSLSPYTLEEVVSRTYLVKEKPDAILNIIDGTNIERNLYLTTQLIELGIPVVMAVNMIDLVRKNGDKIDTNALGKALGCKVVEISALKGTGIEEAAEAAIHAAQNTKTVPQHSFSGVVEHAIAHIEEVALHTLPEEQQRFLSDASHELKTPLTVILSSADLLAESAPAEEQTYVENIRAESRRMKKLVEEMLTLFRAESVRRETAFSEVDLSDVVTDAALRFEPVVFESGRRLLYTIDEGLQVSGDRDALERLTGILLDLSLIHI